MPSDDEDLQGNDQPLKAKIKEATGWATGDRDLEAEGRAEDESVDLGVDDAKEAVRVEHGDKGDPRS